MEKDTVIISLREYNSLRDYKINTKEGLVNLIKYHNSSTNPHIPESTYISKVNADQLLIEKIEDLEKEVESLVKQNAFIANQRTNANVKLDALKRDMERADRNTIAEYRILVHKAIDNIFHKTIWEFRAWRNKGVNIEEFINSFKHS